MNCVVDIDENKYKELMKDLDKKTKDELIAELVSLKNKLKNCEETHNDLNEEFPLEIEDRYMNQLDKNPAAMVIHADGKIMYTNSSTNELIGVKNSKELIGKEVNDFVHPDFKEQNFKRIKELLKDKKPGEFTEETFLRNDGTPFNVIVKGFPIEFKKKKAILVEFWDITKIQKMYDALKESKKYYKTLLDSIDASVFMLDLDLKYISGNRILFERLNLKESDILGKHVSKILAENTAKAFSENALNVISNKQSITFDLEVNTKIGKSVYRVKLSPVLNDFGEIINVLGISNDITEQKNAVHELGYRDEKFRYLIEQADDAILKGDSAGNFTYVNPAAEFITGFSSEKLLTMNMSDLFSKDELSNKPLKYNLLEDGRSILMVRDIVISDGSTITVEMNSKKMLDGTYLCIMRDVSGRKM
ncbi:MAG: PAS domain S-box protein [Candidatus Delongbacteria bacterium]|nr:PAS domain S-box protein [Candidatus Delongbacteria bacterium]